MMHKPERLLKSWHMDTHLRVLSESFPMNIDRVDGFQKSLHPFALNESNLNIRRINGEKKGAL